MNKYNPNIHHRRSIRLKGYDYSQGGLYFINICSQDKICRFGNVQSNEMILNEFGQIDQNKWLKLKERFSNMELDVFQIMLNHIHGIIALISSNISVPVGAGFTTAQNTLQTQNIDVQSQNIIGQLQNNNNNSGQPQGISPTVSDILGAYKSLVANSCLGIYKSKNEIMGILFQCNYCEHIIRNEQSYQTISEYIINNSKKWSDDEFNTL